MRIAVSSPTQSAPHKTRSPAGVTQTLVQLVCTTGWGRWSPRKDMTAIMEMICRSSHDEALRMQQPASYSFIGRQQHAAIDLRSPGFMLDK
jgi:hypothetical protein